MRIGVIAAVGALVGLLFVLSPSAVAGPEPEPVPSRWQLDVRPGALRVLTVEDEQGEREQYYVFQYEVVNNSGEDLFFAPWFDLVTDEGEAMRSGRDVSRQVADAVVGELGNQLIKNEIAIQGRLLQGEENGRLGVAIWPAENLDPDEVTVYLMGFSGETRRIKRPDTGDEVTLRKALMLRHTVPGTIDPSSDRPFERTVERWVLR